MTLPIGLADLPRLDSPEQPGVVETPWCTCRWHSGSLAITLVPVPWLVLAPAAFTQADPRAGPAPSGQTAAFYFGSSCVSGGWRARNCSELAYGDSRQRRRRPSKPWKDRPDHPKKSNGPLDG